MEVGIEVKEIKELIEYRARNYGGIMEAIKIQDRLRKKVGGKNSTEIIREWRDRRRF